MLLLLMMLMAQADTVLAHTDIYHPLTQATAVRVADRSFFCLDRFEQAVWYFDGATGNKKRVARKGQGPGELERANRLLFFEEMLYVLSAEHIQSYNSAGVFQKRVRLPPSMQVAKTADGWVGRKQRLGGLEHTLTFYDQGLKKLQHITTWREEQPRLTPIQGNTIAVPIFPDLGNFTVSRDGRRLYYRHPGQATIHIFETLSKERVGRIVLERRYPFDESQGEAVIEKFKENRPGARVKGDFPKYFPYTSGFHWDPRGFFMVAQWQGKKLKLLRYHPDGRPVAAANFPTDQFERVIDYEQGSFYVSFKDPQREDMSIQRIPEAALETFLQEHPLGD